MFKVVSEAGVGRHRHRAFVKGGWRVMAGLGACGCGWVQEQPRTFRNAPEIGCERVAGLSGGGVGGGPGQGGEGLTAVQCGNLLLLSGRDSRVRLPTAVRARGSWLVARGSGGAPPVPGPAEPLQGPHLAFLAHICSTYAISPDLQVEKREVLPISQIPSAALRERPMSLPVQ